MRSHKWMTAIGLAFAFVFLTSSFVHAQEILIWSRSATEQLHRVRLEVRGMTSLPTADGESITRAELAEYLIEYLDLRRVQQALFPLDGEVNEKASKTEALKTLHAVGLLQGDPSGDLRGQDPLTVPELCTVLLRAMGRDPEAVAAYPAGPVVKAVSMGWVEGAVEEFVSPLQLQRVFSTALLDWENPVVWEGLVAAVQEDGLLLHRAGGSLEEIPWNDPIHLMGVTEIDALAGQVARVLLTPELKVGYVETGQDVRTDRYILEDYDPGRGLLMDGSWHPIHPQWTFAMNGMPLLRPTPLQWRQWSMDDAEVILHQGFDGRGRMELLWWDVPQLVVTAERHEDSYHVFHLRDRAGITYEWRLPVDKTINTGVQGAVESLNRLRAGDVLRVATRYGQGLHSGTVDALWRIHVTRNLREGVVAPDYRTIHHYKDGIRHELQINGDPAILVPEYWVENPIDSLQELRFARVSLDEEDQIVHLHEGLKEDELGPVWVQELQLKQDGRWLRVDRRGRTLSFLVTEELELTDLQAEHGATRPGLGVLQFEAGRVQQIHPVAHRAGDLANRGINHDSVTIFGVDEEDVAIVRVTYPDGLSDYVVCRDPLIYRADGSHVPLEQLQQGMAVSPYTLDTGGYFLLIESKTP